MADVLPFPRKLPTEVTVRADTVLELIQLLKSEHEKRGFKPKFVVVGGDCFMRLSAECRLNASASTGNPASVFGLQVVLVARDCVEIGL